jgi:hypothetical protein
MAFMSFASITIAAGLYGSRDAILATPVHPIEQEPIFVRIATGVNFGLPYWI